MKLLDISLTEYMNKIRVNLHKHGHGCGRPNPGCGRPNPKCGIRDGSSIIIMNCYRSSHLDCYSLFQLFPSSHPTRYVNIRKKKNGKKEGKEFFCFDRSAPTLTHLCHKYANLVSILCRLWGE